MTAPLGALAAFGRALLRATLITLVGAVLAPAVAQPAAAPAPRAARPLARGQTLAATDIDAGAGATGTGDAARLVGWTTRRMIAAGEVLRAPAVAPPAAVRAGDAVALVYAADGLTLRLNGTAAADAPLGGRVAVRVDTRRRFEGVVAGPGLVRLP